MSFGAGIDMSFLLRNPAVVEGQTISFFDDWFLTHGQEMSDSFDDFLGALYIENEDSQAMQDASLEARSAMQANREALHTNLRAFFTANLNPTSAQARELNHHQSPANVLFSGVQDSSSNSFGTINHQGLFSLLIEHHKSGQETTSITSQMDTLSTYLVGQDLNQIPDSVLQLSLVIDMRNVDATNSTLYNQTTQQLQTAEQLQENEGHLALTQTKVQEKNLEFMITANSVSQSSKQRFKAAQQRKEEDQKEEAQQEADTMKAHKEAINQRKEQEAAANKRAAESRRAQNQSKKQKK